MAKLRKTAPAKKRKSPLIPPIPRKIYPEFIESFIKEIEIKTKFKVIVHQYTEDANYQVGVCKPVKHNKHHCIWMSNFVENEEILKTFWLSESFKNS
jgi:hypothetical protein